MWTPKEGTALANTGSDVVKGDDIVAWNSLKYIRVLTRGRELQVLLNTYVVCKSDGSCESKVVQRAITLSLFSGDMLVSFLYDTHTNKQV